MNWNKLIRQTHRWLAIIFTLAVVACFLSLMGTPPQWIFYLPLPPLFLLMFSGLHLFFLPYFRKGVAEEARS